MDGWLAGLIFWVGVTAFYILSKIHTIDNGYYNARVFCLCQLLLYYGFQWAVESNFICEEYISYLSLGGEEWVNGKRFA